MRNWMRGLLTSTLVLLLAACASSGGPRDAAASAVTTLPPPDTTAASGAYEGATDYRIGVAGREVGLHDRQGRQRTNQFGIGASPRRYARPITTSRETRRR